MLGHMPHAAADLNTAAPRSARRVADVWTDLATDTTTLADFSVDMVSGLPEPVARWLLRSIDVGAALRTSVIVTMSGQIRIGAWRAFEARQIIAARRGYIWAAVARFGPLPVRGFDRYSDGSGEMRWRLGGLIPVVTATGDDVSRSAAGRLASELILTPAAALSPGVNWTAVDEDSAMAAVEVDGTIHDVTIHVSASGTLDSIELLRWGDPDQTGFGLHRFSAVCTGELRSDGFGVPAHTRAGWGDLEAFIDFDTERTEFL
ncbi:MAG: hypothetical protein C0482_02005 [Gordonia sp.]|nr:hypothetical protein [Gordonia sp. (in: high G+C Gram-positive bacteria)]